MKFVALLASATAAAAAAVSPRQTDLLYPHRTYRRWVHSGEMVDDPQDQLLVVKNGNLDDETSAVVSFAFPEETEGKQCQLRFELWPDRDISTGSQTLDVFTYNNLPEDVGTLANILERDTQAGRIKALTDRKEAEWIESYDGWPTIPCPAGETIGIEYVGVGDEVEVQWDIGVTGPRFQVLE
ncbi:hypothetical protein VUR80DRAFT_9442 [Thermomyces stellatus]